MTIELTISIVALIISGLSLLIALFTFVSNAYLNFSELKSSLLTKLSTLRIEYENLQFETSEALANLQKIPSSIITSESLEENHKKFIQNTEEQSNHVAEFLRLTEDHYNKIHRINFMPLGAVMLEKMLHHIESLSIQMIHDRKRFKVWIDQLQLIEKLPNEHKRIKEE